MSHTDAYILCESMRFFEYSFIEVIDNFPLDKFFRSKRAVGLSISSTLSTGHWKNKSSAHAARWDLCQGVIVVPRCTGPTLRIKCLCMNSSAPVLGLYTSNNGSGDGNCHTEPTDAA